MKTPECGFEIFNDLLGENVGNRKFVGPFEAFLANRSIGSRLIASEMSIMFPESSPSVGDKPVPTMNFKIEKIAVLKKSCEAIIRCST